MSDESIPLRPVRFLVYHGGMGADVGDILHVAAEWAARALAAGIVEAVTEAEAEAQAQAVGETD